MVSIVKSFSVADRGTLACAKTWDLIFSIIAVRKPAQAVSLAAFRYNLSLNPNEAVR
jgi:hypothetical protein